jgi:hypothetical protein
MSENEERMGGMVVKSVGTEPPEGAQQAFRVEVVTANSEDRERDKAPDGMPYARLLVNGVATGPSFPESGAEFMLGWFTEYLTRRVEAEIARQLMEKPEGQG